MPASYLLLAIPPASVTLGFLLHWLTIRDIGTSSGRLPFCRGAYLAFSLQLLLYAWGLFFLSGPKNTGASLIPLAMSFSSAGDYFNLQFPAMRKRIKEPVFLGILSFAAAQCLYVGAFLSFVPVKELASRGFLYPLLILFPTGSALIFRLRVFRKDRPKTLMRGGFLYSFALGAMAATALSAAIARGGGWFAVAAGALFFLLSDAFMGQTTLYGRHPAYEYQIPWGAYLAAQGLILFGTAASSITVPCQLP